MDHIQVYSAAATHSEEQHGTSYTGSPGGGDRGFGAGTIQEGFGIRVQETPELP